MNLRQWNTLKNVALLFSLLAVSIFVMLAKNGPLVRSLRAGALETTARVEQTMNWLGRYLRALEENEQLRRDNIVLSSQLARSREAQVENNRLQQLLGFQDTTAYRLRPARIISKEIARPDNKNAFTLDVGRRDGVEVGMGVVDERGILGRVILTSAHYTRVVSYLNTDFRVSAKVQPLQASGIVRWDGDRLDRLLMEHVIKTEPVEKGQLIVSSGFSQSFPDGYPIGQVDSVYAPPGENQLTIYLTPASPLHRVEHAFVLLHRPDPERIELESDY